MARDGPALVEACGEEDEPETAGEVGGRVVRGGRRRGPVAESERAGSCRRDDSLLDLTTRSTSHEGEENLSIKRSVRRSSLLAARGRMRPKPSR